LFKGNDMTLFGDFLKRDHRRSHKWNHYFPIYEQHAERFRNRYVTLFEIGLGEGGSLAMWKAFLGPHARIVGIDIEPMCRQYEDEQISIRIGSQDDKAFLRTVLEEFGAPDIVIDDGSHIQQHINATFEVFYPHVAKNGFYLVEDLHSAYWPDHGAGLRHPESFIERAKGYVDEMHADYTGGQVPNTALGDRTASIHFYDSIIVLEVGEHRHKSHQLIGDRSLFRDDWTPAEPRGGATVHLPDSRPVLTHAAPLPSGPGAAPAAQLEQRLKELSDEVAVLRGSTSWRVTQPLRAVGRLFGKR
jgi:hypothetical protein